MNKFLKIAGLNFATLFVLLIISDLALGDWFKKKPPIANIPASIWGKKITYDGSMITGKQNIEYKRDDKGYRNLEDYTKDNIILTIGGSTTDQRYVTDGKTWQDKLDSLFSKRYQFANGGIDGQSTYGHLFSINQWHSKIFPPQNIKAIVFYFGINDIRLLDGNLNAYDKKQSSSVVNQIKTELGNNSFFYQRGKIIRDRQIAQKNGIKNNTVVWAGHSQRVQKFIDTNPPSLLTLPNTDEYSYYKSLISDLVKATNKHFPNAKVVFVQQQVPGCKFLTSIRYVDRHPISDTNTATTCKKLGEAYLSQDQSIASMPYGKRPTVLKMYLRQPISDNGVYDYVHTNESGSAEIAQYLKDNLPLDSSRNQ